MQLSGGTVVRFKTAAVVVAMIAALAPPTLGAAAGKTNAYDVSITALMANPELRAKLPAGVTYYFADQPVAVKSSLGPVVSNRRTSNGKGPGACDWAMVSALTALGEAALAKGGNAVVGIRSNLEGVQTSSRTTYRCGLGTLMVNVALTGEAAVVE